MKAILSIVFLSFALVASASNPVVESFINGSQMELTNSTTYNFGATNVLTFAPVQNGGLWNGQALSAFWSRTSSNMVATTGQSRTNWVPYVAYLTNRAAFSSTNQTAGGYINNTNVTQPYAWVDIPMNCDGSAQPMQGAITVTAACDSAAGTNLLTLLIRRSVDGVYFDDQSANKMQFTVAVSGITNNTLSTNLSTVFTTGAQKLRLATLTVADSTTNKWVYVKSITLGSYSKP